MTARSVVLSLGRLYCDLIFTGLPRMPTLGTEVYADGLGVHAGGGAFITAAHLASLGHHSALAAMHPPAPFDSLLADELGRSGVDLRFCQSPPRGSDPQVTAALGAQGDRAFVTRRNGPAFPPLVAGDLTGLGVAHVHVGELATLVERPEIIALARDAGATLSLDCSWDDGLPTSALEELISQVDVFLPNETEMQHLEEIGVSIAAVPLVAIKQGADGAMARQDGQGLHVPACLAKVVDTTGAGDAFNAGFLSAWLGGASLQDCLMAGNAQGAIAVSQRGGFRGAAKAAC